MDRNYDDYDTSRNIPSIDGTTRLSPYLAFGIISARETLRHITPEVEKENHDYKVILSELGWRDYWNHIAIHFPYVRTDSFQEKRRNIKRDNDPILFKARCEGHTGYPIVDAGMRELVQTKYMHNRVRMVVASFLTKDLLIDRKRGEKFFAQHLLDYDSNINNGNRQWSASV